MGLADRSYMRAGSGSPRGSFARRVWSFTTWLIALNVLVLVLNQWVFNQRVWMPFGRVALPGVSAERLQQGFVPKDSPANQLPGQSGIRFRAVYGPATNQPALPGRAAIMPQYVQIGTEREIESTVLHKWGHFSTATGFYPGLEVWRFITFQFLHADITHLAFNLLGLWFAGPLVEGQLGRKRFAAFYLTCGIFGALMYLLLNLTGNLLITGGAAWASKMPVLLFSSTFTPLVGASAGIFGVLLAAAHIAPNNPVLIFGIIPAKLRTAVYGFTLVSFVSLVMGSQNAGGEAAHIGGAIAGAFFIRHMHLLRDFFDIFGDSRTPTREAVRAAQAKPKRGWFGGSTSAGATTNANGAPDPAEVDRILRKINDSGVASLNADEKETLFRDTRAKRGEL